MLLCYRNRVTKETKHYPHPHTLMLAWQYIYQSKQSLSRKDQRISLAFSFWRTGFSGKGFSHGDPQNHRIVRIMERPKQKGTHKYHWKKIGWYWSHSENITHCSVTTLRSLAAIFLQSCSETGCHWNGISLAFRQITMFWLQIYFACHPGKEEKGGWRQRCSVMFHLPAFSTGVFWGRNSERVALLQKTLVDVSLLLGINWTEMMHGFLSVFSPDTCMRKISFLTFSPWIV